jgi:hypothetical protein
VAPTRFVKSLECTAYWRTIVQRTIPIDGPVPLFRFHNVWFHATQDRPYNTLSQSHHLYCVDWLSLLRGVQRVPLSTWHAFPHGPVNKLQAPNLFRDGLGRVYARKTDLEVKIEDVTSVPHDLAAALSPAYRLIARPC